MTHTLQIKQLLTIGCLALLGGLSNLAHAQASAVFNRVGDSVGLVVIMDQEGQLLGSGSAVTVAYQTMVTNRHVLAAGTKFMVIVGGNRFDATPGPCDAVQDLCLITVLGLEAKPVEFGPVNNLAVGDAVFAVGAPNEVRNMVAVSAVTKQKQISPPQMTLSNGLVTALRPVEDGFIIQTNAAISPGSSGGGLFDARGRLIGITTFQMRDSQGLNMALPVNWVQRLGVSGSQPANEVVAQSTPQASSASNYSEAPAVASDSDTKSRAVSAVQNTSAQKYPLWWGAVPLVLVILFIWRRARGRSEEAEDIGLEHTTHTPAVDPRYAHLHAQVISEIEANQTDQALWSQAVLENKGNAAAVKASYIRKRLGLLISAEKDRQWAEAAQKIRT